MKTLKQLSRLRQRWVNANGEKNLERKQKVIGQIDAAVHFRTNARDPRLSLPKKKQRELGILPQI